MEHVERVLTAAALAPGMEPQEEPAQPEPEDAVLDSALEAQITQMGKRTAEALRRHRQEKVIIPADPLNKHDQFVTVGINGWVFRIQRETPVVLPEPVVDLLEQGGYNPKRVR